MEERITITINKKIWKRLSKLKLDKDLRSFDEVLKEVLKEYGNKSWELDALEPKVLIKIAEKGVKEFCDLDKYNYWIEREEEEKKALKDFGDSLLEKEEKDGVI